MTLLESQHHYRRKTGHAFGPGQKRFIFVEQMLAQDWLNSFPTTLRLLAHFTIRWPETEHHPCHSRVEQRPPQPQAFTMKLLGKVLDLRGFGRFLRRMFLLR